MIVTELANKFGVSPDAIRHYCKLGLLSPERSENNGYRHFNRDDEQRLQFLLRAKAIGFSLKDIRAILEMAENGVPTCPAVRRMLENRIGRLRGEIDERRQLLETMEDASLKWQALPDPDAVDGQICGLIETLDGEAWMRRSPN